MHLLVIIVIAALVLVLVLAIRTFVRKRNQADGIYTFRSRFGRVRIHSVEGDDGSPVRVMSVDGAVQSAAYLDERWCEPVFTYHRLFDAIFEGSRPIESVLVLGSGGCEYVRHLIAHHPNVRVKAVEADPMMVGLARRFFFLDRLEEEYGVQANGRLSFEITEAHDYLVVSDETFDAVICDLYAGGSPDESMRSQEGVALIRAHVNPGGVVASNIVSALEGEESGSLKRAVALFEDAFEEVDVLSADDAVPHELDNRVLIARAG